MRLDRKPKFYVYLLRCYKTLFSDKYTFYTGLTNNLQRRYNQHLHGESTYTKRFEAVELCYRETFSTRDEAVAREKQIKKMLHAEKAKLVADYERAAGYRGE